MAWPTDLPGELIVAYLSGVLLILGAIAIIAKQKSTWILIIVAGMLLVWAGVRNAIHVIMELDTGAALTSMGKAFTFGFGALLVAQSLTSSQHRILRLAFLCRYFTGLFLLFSGVQHFLYADFVKFLIPGWIPGAIFWTYFSAIALVAAGIGLITGVKGKLTANLAGWMILTWFFLLHIPRAIENNNQNEWTAVFEALAVSGVLFLLAHRVYNKSH